MKKKNTKITEETLHKMSPEFSIISTETCFIMIMTKNFATRKAVKNTEDKFEP